MIKVLKKTMLFILLMNANAVFAEGEIGVASAVNKNTTDLTLAEERRLIQAGYKIIQNHTLETDAIGRAALLLIDGTSFSIGPNSSVTLDKFIYNPETAEGSLEVSSRGLLRLVGGKVTKKRPALIRTNSATVGIRGGITIVQTQGLSTSAAFVYGDELTMTPNQNSSAATSLTENGFIVTVEDPTAEVGDPEQLSETFLAELQKGLEARENDEESDGESSDENSEEESTEEESTEEESTEEESTEEESTEEESTEEESNEQESNEEQSQESDETSDENTSEEQTETTTEENNSSDTEDKNNETRQEDSAETESDNETAQADVSSDSGSDTQTSDQLDTTTEVDDDPQPDVDESALDSSGVSDNSSDIAPSELSTSDDVVDTEVDIDATSDEVEETAEETEEASDTSIEDNAAVETTETVIEEAPFDASLTNENIQFNENETDINLTNLITNKDDDVEVIVTIEGDDKDSFLFDASSNTLIFIGSANYEDKTNFSLNLIVQREDEEVVIPVNISVLDVNEAPSVSAEIQDSYAEDLSIGSVLVGVTISDPENQEVTYSISGEGSDKFSIDEAGNITLAESFDFEAKASYALTVTATDGELSSETEVLINVGDINEAPDVIISLQGSEFAENITTGSTIATVAYTDPESDTLTYTLSGTGNDQFSVDDQGVITLKTGLDYETKTSYELTLTSSDGTNSVQTQINFLVTDIAELALSLDSTKITLAENISTGSSIAQASFSDAAGEVTYSIVEGTAESSIFAIDSQGRITLESSLDFEAKTSYTLEVSVTDGKETVTKQLEVTVSDVDLSVTSSLASASQAETISTGTSILTLSTSNAEGTLSYSITDADNKFAINSSTGEVTLANALDYETKTSHSFTVIVTDGTTTSSETFTLSVTDVDLSVILTLASSSQAETISTGTSILTLSTSNAEGTVSYSITDADNKFAINSSTGEVTLANALDYETKTSHSFTVIVTDGTTTSSETFTLNVTDVDLTLSSSLASSSQLETISTGTTIVTSSTSNSEGTVSYSLTDDDNKFSIDSSTGEVTLSNALDYETKTSHSFTVTATDGVTTTSQTFTLTVGNAVINTLAVTLTNSGAALAESSSSGTSVGSSSINNPESDSVTYTLSGTGSSNFAVDSSGNITTNATLDFETAKSYALKLTASGGGATTIDNFTVTVGNVEELNSAVLRYSAAYNSASRAGFSATATRGPSGSSLSDYYLEQVGTTNTTNITSVDDTTNNFVPVEINGGTQLNWRYYFPIDTSSYGQYTFAPNSVALDGKYYSPLGTAVTTTIANTDFISAGRDSNGGFWFMTTDKAAANISYSSSTGQRTYGMIIGNSGENGCSDFPNQTTCSGLTVPNNNYTNTWQKAIEDAGYTFINCMGNVATCLSNNGLSNLDDVGIIVRNALGTVTYMVDNASSFADWIDGGGNFYMSMWEHSGGCCGSATDLSEAQGIFSELGWSGLTGGNAATSATQTIVDLSSISGTSLDYTAIANKAITPATTGAFNSIPSVCNAMVGGTLGLFICDPGRTGSSGTVMGSADTNLFSQFWTSSDEFDIMEWFAGLGNGATPTTSTYNLYEDQVTLAGEVYKDAEFAAFTQNGKRVISMAIIPIENFAASGSNNDYFYPNFIPTNLWSYGDVGVDYCTGYGHTSSECNSEYERNYTFSTNALATNSDIDTNRWLNSNDRNELPEGLSKWWQVLNGSGVGVGLWAQISFKDSYDGASGSTTRDDQESLLNVIISNIDYRKNDTTRYSAGDTGLGMDGYHYWSYQGATNANNDGLGINYGTSVVECATSTDSGCFWAEDLLNNSLPSGIMITSSDPYKSGDMTLSVNYNSNTDTFSTGTFDVAAYRQSVRYISNPQQSATLSNFRNSTFYASSASSYSGFFSGILEFDVSGSGNSQLASMRSSSTLASFSFDTTNDDLQVVAPMTISAAPSNNYTSNWSTVDTGSMTVKFGDATNDEAKSAYISSEVFAAEIQDDGAQIDGTSGGSNNLAGVMVSYNTLDKEDSDLFHTGGNDSMPNTEYSTWGFWAMSAADISPNSGDQNASVHLGTWVGGELVDQNEIPTSGSASMSGAAAVNVAYRHNQTGTNYDVHKYTTTADVAASFNWGASGYSGTLDFTNFDDKNPIVANAGFASFSVAIAGTNNTYTGTSTDSLDNSWLGGAAVAGALFGDSSPTESGGRVNVNLYKSGDTGTAGANDFYMAEGIYLICASGGC